MGEQNPIRWRGHYYDAESGLYYADGRYYDPEVGQYLDAIEIPEAISEKYLDRNGILCDNILELMPYMCSVLVNMAKDPACTDTEEGIPWWGWLLFGIGAALVVAAATVLTLGAFGIAAGGLVGAVLHGAAVGTLIGAGAGATIGVGAGAIYAWVTGSDMLTSILTGGMTGFGIGAVIGAVIGGTVGANSWYNAIAKQFTNIGSKEVVLGRSPGYVDIAKSRGATYFNTSDKIWNATKSLKGVGNKGMWRINKAFLKQQIKAGAHFT